MGKLISIICAVLFIFAGNIGWAQEGKLASIVHNIQTWYDTLLDFQADFQQKTFSQSLKISSEARGKIYFKKPHLMKWEYEVPEIQIYIIDQDNFWWYVPEDAQVVKKKAESVLGDATPLSFLAGMGDLQRSFLISLPKEKKAEDANQILYVHLIPRQESGNIKQMQLKLAAKTFHLMGMVVVDPYGNTNDIDFIHIQINQGLQEKIFHFVPPQGVDIINGDAEQAGTSSKPF